MTNYGKPPLEELYLEHYGVKGMRWGVRNEDKRAVSRFQGSGPVIDSGLHKTTVKAANDVARLFNERYGFPITAVKRIPHDDEEYERGTLGYVSSNPGKREGVIHMRDGDTMPAMKASEKSGWVGKGCGHPHGLLTHEASHALFHADMKVKRSFLGKTKVTGSNLVEREKAFEAAVVEARKKGIRDDALIGSISGYAKFGGNIQEVEAELFSQYHWGTNPPSFVKAWGETLHKEMGIDPTPFRKTK